MTRLLVPAGLVATVRLEEPTAEVIDGGPADVLDEMALQIPGLQQAVFAPKPSTVPMRVSVAMRGSGTPARIRKRACSTLGKERSHHSSGTSISSVENRALFCSPHALIAGSRNFVRGDT